MIKTLKLCSQCIAGFLILFALSQIFSVFIQCIPVAALWDPLSYPGYTCDNYASALFYLAIVNVCTDIIILALPLPILWKLQVTPTRKRQLLSIFLLGGL